MVIIHALQQNDIRRITRNDAGDGLDLAILTTQRVAQQQAGAFAFQLRMIGCDAQPVLTDGLNRADQNENQDQKNDQTC